MVRVFCSQPPRGRGKRKSSEIKALERSAVTKALEIGVATKIVYSSPPEAYSRSQSLRNIGGSEVRVIGDKENANAVIVGPRS